MFGYIRPVQGELLVKEYELYRAVYCGLCRFGGKNISHFTRFLLNYDFVALALLRLAITNEEVSVTKERCPYRFKKRNTLVADSSYELTCSAFAILTYYKAIDDINDSKRLKKLFKKTALPFFSNIRRRAKRFDELDSLIAEQLKRLSELEKSGSDELDRVADCFAKITAEIASFKLDGTNKLIASQCGYHIGRYIYIIDALDDILDDEKEGNYNPLLKKYGTSDEVFKNLEVIKTTLTDSLNAFSASYGLATVSGENRKKDYDNIIFNICELGGRAGLEKVLKRLTGKATGGIR